MGFLNLCQRVHDHVRNHNESKAAGAYRPKQTPLTEPSSSSPTVKTTTRPLPLRPPGRSWTARFSRSSKCKPPPTENGPLGHMPKSNAVFAAEYRYHQRCTDFIDAVKHNQIDPDDPSGWVTIPPIETLFERQVWGDNGGAVKNWTFKRGAARFDAKARPDEDSAEALYGLNPFEVEHGVEVFVQTHRVLHFPTVHQIKEKLSRMGFKRQHSHDGSSTRGTGEDLSLTIHKQRRNTILVEAPRTL